jgi:hypothetical protein
VLRTYDPSTNPTEPESYGLYAGTHVDGSNIYVGIGFTSECSNQPVLPARISTQYGGAAGAYMTCGTTLFDGTTAQYIANDPRLKWVPSSGGDVPSAVSIASGPFNLYIGRKQVTSNEGVGYAVVSKVHHDNGATGFWYTTDDGSEIGTLDDFEVLTCG